MASPAGEAALGNLGFAIDRGGVGMATPSPSVKVVCDLGGTDDTEIPQEAAEVATLVSPMGGLIKGVGVGDLHVSRALAVKASSVELRRQRKDDYLQKKREAFARKMF
jgi:hypothetical protein